MHCNLLILQHPQERKKYYGTAKIVCAAVRNSKLRVGEEFETTILRKTLDNSTPYLLFPSNEAKSCQDVELTNDCTLIVLDGTWSQAGKLLRRSPDFGLIPKLTFSNAYLSRYRIRKQPKPMYLSTIEAVAYFLKESAMNCQSRQSIERIEHYNRLLGAFDLMVEKQLQYWPRSQ